MFFKKKKDVTMFRFLGILPGVPLDELQLEKVGEFLRVVLSKFYQREEISKVKTFIEDLGLSLDDFTMEEIKIDEKKNLIATEHSFNGSGPRLNIPLEIIPGSNIYVEDEKLENALLKLKISGFVPARSSEYFTQLSWGELSKSFIQEHISLANNFNWMEGRTDIYENKDTGEIKALIVDFVPSPLGS